MHKRRGGGLPLPASLVFRKKSSLFHIWRMFNKPDRNSGSQTRFPCLTPFNEKWGERYQLRIATKSPLISVAAARYSHESGGGENLSPFAILPDSFFASLHCSQCSLALFLGAAAARSCPLLPCPSGLAFGRLADSPSLSHSSSCMLLCPKVPSSLRRQMSLHYRDDSELPISNMKRLM